MNKKNKRSKFFPVLLCTFLLALSGCGDSKDPDPTPTTGETTTVSFEKVVALGDSLFAGIQVVGTAKDYKVYPEDAIPVKFVVQTGKTAGSETTGKDFVFPKTSGTNNMFSATLDATSKAYTKPFNLLAFPAARVQDLNATSMGVASGDTTKDAMYNSYFKNLLRSNTGEKFVSANNTPADQAVYLSPTFVMIWIGTNNLLIPAADGMTSTTTGSFVTKATFKAEMKKLIDKVKGASTKPKIAMFTLPDVLLAPYFYEMKAGDATKKYVKEGTAVARELAVGEYLTYPGYMMTLAAGDARKGLAMNTPIDGDKYWLSAAEVLELRKRHMEYNEVIRELGDMYKFPVVNVDTLMTSLAMSSGYSAYGVKLKNTMADKQTADDYYPAFTKDGLHLTSKAHAVLTNKLIEAVNRYYTNATKVGGITDVKTVNDR